MTEHLFCAQWPILVLILMFVFRSLSCCKIQLWPIIRFLAGTVSFFFLSLGIWLNPWMMPYIWFTGPLAEKWAHNFKDIEVLYVSLYTQGTFYSCEHQTNLECLLLKISFFSFIWQLTLSPVWSSSSFWKLNMLEFVFSWNAPKQLVVI